MRIKNGLFGLGPAEILHIFSSNSPVDFCSSFPLSIKINICECEWDSFKYLKQHWSKVKQIPRKCFLALNICLLMYLLDGWPTLETPQKRKKKEGNYKKVNKLQRLTIIACIIFLILPCNCSKCIKKLL